MPGRRQIRETVVQFLYCADLEGGAEATSLREPFWDFITESDRKALHVATYRTLLHLAQGRDERVAKFVERANAADAMLAGSIEHEPLRRGLRRILELESAWSAAFAALSRLPMEGDDDALAERFAKALDHLFALDRDLSISRGDFLAGVTEEPVLRGRLEPVVSAVRRLERVSERVRMVADPGRFPEQPDLAKLRESADEIRELRERTDRIVDAILANKPAIDARIAAVVENFAPERIDPVDRAILRLAIHEIRQGEAPLKVVINEAIELAKRFGTTESGRFVNGVLDRIGHEAAT
ncbi:MAG: transcription antitermination factor NusB [Luteolibacter sp.]